MSMALSWMMAVICVLFSAPVNAELTSYRNAHPLGWMHSLPVGETPGWNGRGWFNLELNHANIWNKEFEMVDRRNGAVYTYEADFEQSTAVVDMGVALSKEFAFAVEIPYANRNGGFLDDFIDQFHQFIQSDRFLRHLNDEFENSYVMRTDGEDHMSTPHGQGVGNVKFKFKWWPIQWFSKTPGVCNCGLSFSGQVKVPTQRRESGLSSGHADYSALIHFGVPVWDYVGIWATAAFTRLGENDNIPNWPRRTWAQMYELTMDLGMGKNFGFVIQVRTESPLLMTEHLEYQYTTNDPNSQQVERIASGWNSLVEWRGSQGLGFRWRWGKGHRANLLLIEDWGLGDKDNRGDNLYVNNAPDVAFVSQWHFVF